jgi:uncharacterized protein YndB with AHSA1/START domain
MMRGRKGPAWSVDINAPRERVFEYVADFSRHPEWSMDDMVISGHQGPTHEGATYDAEGTLRGKRNKSTVFVSEIDPPNRIEFEAQDSSGITGHVFTFTPQNGGTHVTRELYAVKQPALAPLLYVFFRGSINKNFNGALQKLKARVESGA